MKPRMRLEKVAAPINPAALTTVCVSSRAEDGVEDGDATGDSGIGAILSEGAKPVYLGMTCFFYLMAGSALWTHQARRVPDFWSVTASPLKKLTCQATMSSVGEGVAVQ